MAGWRAWNVLLHRDVGYVAAGLTLVYAVSGVAVNHRADWNPNTTMVREERRFAPMPVGERDAMVAALVKALDLPPPRDAFRSRPDQVELFYEGWSVKADTTAGLATLERPRDRPVLREVNYLHLNDPKGAWTWVADAFAVALAFLALSGVLIPRGKHGLAGHGKYFLLVGLAIPLGFLAAMRWR